MNMVISLGGSVIVPDKLDVVFLRRFRNIIRKNYKNRFIIICGGGKLARKLQEKARKPGKSQGVITDPLQAELLTSLL